MTLSIDLNPNPLCPNLSKGELEKMIIEKFGVLFGKNGSGKSLIMEGIFEDYLNDPSSLPVKIVCVSSGQNEGYSGIYGKHLSNQRDVRRGLNLNCVYYDKAWANLLIFMATSLYPDGKARELLVENKYVDQSTGKLKNDLSSKLEFTFTIPQDYKSAVEEAKRNRDLGKQHELLSSQFYGALKNFCTHILRTKEIESVDTKVYSMTAKQLSELKFDDPQEGSGNQGTSINGMQNVIHSFETSFGVDVGFLTQIADLDSYLDKKSLKLTFKNGLELRKLSDGEFQLLLLYAIIDLFDSPNTLFLIDEADSHVHYQFIRKLWSIFYDFIKGYALTTSHQVDSFACTRIESLLYVENGQIKSNISSQKFLERMSVISHVRVAQFEHCGKQEHLVVIDHINDWIIFLVLAKQLGLPIEELEESFHVVARESTYDSINQVFGGAKIEWVNSFRRLVQVEKTKNIVLICDRDEAKLDLNPANGVEVNGSLDPVIGRREWWKNHFVTTHLYSWDRREVKNFLPTYTVLKAYNRLHEVNNERIARDHWLKPMDPCDNESIANLRVKAVVDDLINSGRDGLDRGKLESYVGQIPRQEIGGGIGLMHSQLIEVLKNVGQR